MSPLFFAIVGLLVALGLFIWLAQSSDIVRDATPTALAARERRPYSLAKCQMAFWFLFTLGSYLVIFATTGHYNGIITDQSLILLGISSATGLSAIAVDSNKAAAAGAAPVPPPPPPVHATFLIDLLTDANGVTMHRFQMLVWTLVLGIVYIVSVAQSHTLPNLDNNLLTLMGISSGVYVGFKFPEKQA